MTSRPMPQCLVCKHWRSPLDRDDVTANDRGEPVQVCTAYPKGIPGPIWWNRADHRQTQPGDHGVGWEPVDDDAEFPEWAMAQAS